MVRKSLNTSVRSTASELFISESAAADESYSEFMKKLDYQANNEQQDIKFIGYEATSSAIKSRLGRLFDEHYEPEHVLLHGPSGTGKTTLLKQLVRDQPQITFFYLKSTWMTMKIFGNLESRLMKLFEEAKSKKHSVIFIDNIDKISGGKSEIKDRLVNLLDYLLENLQSRRSKVIVFVATRDPASLDRDLKETYFTDEIEFKLPTKEDRSKMLRYLLPSLSQEATGDAAESTQHYAFSDLKRIRTFHRETKDIKSAIERSKPTRIKSIISPHLYLSWDDIGGVEHAKRELKESFIVAMEHKEKYEQHNMPLQKGILLYGPPGCSKTMLAQALATESGFNFLMVKGPELFSKYVGDSEGALRKLYRNAREIAPCIVFIDEIDGLAAPRSDEHNSPVGDRLVTQLLTELNSESDHVFTVAATNRPDKVDGAVIRSGRLEPIYIPLPGAQDREKIFSVLCRRHKVESKENIQKLAGKTDGFSGAEIQELFRKSFKMSISEGSKGGLELRHFEAALEMVEPQTSQDLFKVYKKFQSKGKKNQDKLTEQLSNLTIRRRRLRPVSSRAHSYSCRSAARC